MRRLTIALLSVLLFWGCAHKKPITQAQPVSPPPESEKPKPRPIKPGDYVLKGIPEVLPDGTVVCHKAILLIDARKKKQDVDTFLCR